MLMQTQGVGDRAGWLRVAEHNAATWLLAPPRLEPAPGHCGAPAPLFPWEYGSRAGRALLTRQAPKVGSQPTASLHKEHFSPRFSG